MKKVLIPIVAVIALLVLAWGGWNVYVLCGGLDKSFDPEMVIETLRSPDGEFSIVVTKTKECWPYGVQGNIYLCVKGSSGRKHVSDYFTDDHGETMAFLKWSEKDDGFIWSGKSSGDIVINPHTMGASNKELKATDKSAP